MAPSRLIGRALTRWHHTTAAPQPAVRLISFYVPSLTKPSCTRIPCSENGINIDQHRYRSDLLKYRAVEALKKKKNGAADTAANNIDKKSDGSPIKEVGNNLDFGDDHQLAGLTAAAAKSVAPEPNDSNVSTKGESGLESSPRTAPPRTTNTSEDTLISTRGTSNSDPVQEVTNNNPQAIESSPWAHMQLHEFAPKIVVVGVGGAGTNAVNNMVASGLSGKLFCVEYSFHRCL